MDAGGVLEGDILKSVLNILLLLMYDSGLDKGAHSSV